MAVLSRRACACNPENLPLFEWAGRQAIRRQPKLLVTKKLARLFDVPQATLNAWAETNGFTATGDGHDD